MRRLALLLLPLSLLAAQPARAGDLSPESVLQALTELGRLNGTALVIQRPPKTRQYGEAFEGATQNAFLERSRQGGTCPAAPELARKAEALAEQLPPASADAVAR